MATASSLAGTGRDNAYDSIAATSTDSVLVAAVAGKKIRVLAVVLNQGDTTASAITFNSKGAGAGTRIFPDLKAAANGGFVIPENPGGWFETNLSEGLSVSTGVGSATSVSVTFAVVSP